MATSDFVTNVLQHVYEKVEGSGITESNKAKPANRKDYESKAIQYFFDQRPIIEEALADFKKLNPGETVPSDTGLADSGVLYYPTACATKACKLMYFSHGCGARAEGMATAWAPSAVDNEVIMVFP